MQETFRERTTCRRNRTCLQPTLAFLTELKERIRTARIKAALCVNRELVLLYWSIGRDILAK